ncbi:hypothetical protein K435DRAFT_670510, partial [Dendrothele bispora CBS 962.96]
IRVEWCKSFARAKRWSEEVVLVKEEMRRVLVTLEHKASEWDKRQEFVGPLAQGRSGWDETWRFASSYDGSLAHGTDRCHAEGVKAYANSQASLYRQLEAKFRRMWAGVGQKEKELEAGEDLSIVMRRVIQPDDGNDSSDEEDNDVDINVLTVSDNEDD